MCFKRTVGRAIGAVAMLTMAAPVASQETSGTDEVFQLILRKRRRLRV